MDPRTESSGFSVTVDGTRRIIKPARGPRVLVLEMGKGVLSISLLQYLKEIMQEISRLENGNCFITEVVHPALPCDYFDLICGSRMGGLFAVLLGHLGMSIDEVSKWLWEHASWVYQPDSRLDVLLFKGPLLPLSFPPNWRRRCSGSDMRSRWRVCLRALMEERLGPVAGESQPFTNPITGRSCKTCVLTWKINGINGRFRIHRFRSYSIGDSDLEGNAEERNCPIWKVAWISIHDNSEDEELEGFHTDITLGNDERITYSATKQGFHKTDREAYDEMVHIWKSVDDSCFVSVESMRKENFSDRHPFSSALLLGIGGIAFEANDTRPGPPETYLPKSASVHRFEFRYTFQIKSGMWEAWDQVLKEFNESKPSPAKYTGNIVSCAVRLLGAPSSEIDRSSFVAPVPNHSSSAQSRQGDRQGTIQEGASDNGSNQGAGALYDVTTRSCYTTSTSQTHVDNWFKRIRETNQTFFGGITPEGSAVRVAILDTGINEQYPELQTNQIKDKWSFNPSLNKGYEDLDGHGSHAAAVLLRVAPQCELYIARIFKDTRDVNAQNIEYINKALRCAIHVWKVDIISMSFGFSEDLKNSEFKELLTQEAARNGVLIFSAASNSGANDDIAFPACWRGHVFCINSTDTSGTPSRFNPPKDSKGYNFSTLGESVPGPTPDLNSEQLECQIRSGTSIATPIAAGIAALILEFSRVRGVKIKNIAKLKTCDGMATVLEDLSTDVGGYQYLRPWKIADSTENNQKIYAGHLDYILGKR